MLDEDYGKTYGFDRLFDALYICPENVPSMIKEEPSLLSARNYAGETVINWLAMEGYVEPVELLISCGANIDSLSITVACGPGQVDMVYLLLNAGGVPDISACELDIRVWKTPHKTRVKLRQAFHRYGYSLNV